MQGYLARTMMLCFLPRLFQYFLYSDWLDLRKLIVQEARRLKIIHSLLEPHTMYTYCVLKDFLRKKGVQRDLSRKLSSLSSLQFFDTIIDDTKFGSCPPVSFL
jgi:hypothetical protein